MFRFTCRLLHIDTSNPEQTTLLADFSTGSGDFPEHKITSPGIKLQLHALVDALLEQATNRNLPDIGKPAALADVMKAINGIPDSEKENLEITLHQNHTETIFQVRLPV